MPAATLTKSPREQQVLMLWRKHAKATRRSPSNRFIADELGISVGTAGYYAYTLQHKGLVPRRQRESSSPRPPRPPGPLTPRQAEIYDFIRRSQGETGLPTTIRDIGKGCGIGSPNGVVCHLKAMRDKGYVTWERNISRSIRIVGPKCQCCNGTGVLPCA